jgi:hypothetical protein
MGARKEVSEIKEFFLFIVHLGHFVHVREIVEGKMGGE